MRLLIAAFLAVFLMPAERAAATHCFSAARLMEAALTTASRMPILVEHDMGGDRVLVLGQPGSLKVLVAMFHQDCIMFRSFIRRDVVEDNIIPTITEAL